MPVLLSARVASNGALSIYHIASNGAFQVSSGTTLEATLEIGGVAISNTLNGYTPIGIEAITGGGYEVMFEEGASYVGLDFNAGGNFTSAATGVLTGSSYALESLESGFNTDLNADGTTGVTSTTIAYNTQGAALFDLVQVADEYEITVGGSVQGILTVAGTPITSSGQSDQAVALLVNAGGYEVMFESADTNIFEALQFNTAGAYVSAATGQLHRGTYALESLESSFRSDLNRVGVVGPHLTPVVSNGLYTIGSLTDAYAFTSAGTVVGPLVVSGTIIFPGGFNGYAPVGLLSNTPGYEVMFQSGTTFVGLEFNAAGTFTSAATSALQAGSYALESLDAAFNTSLDQTGRIGPNTSSIGTNGVYGLMLEADNFAITSGGSIKVFLQSGGSDIVSGSFNGYSPIAMLSNAAGYEVMFRNGTSFVGIEFDPTGNLTSAATGVLQSGTYALDSLDGAFNATLDLHSPTSTLIDTNSGYSLFQVDDVYELTNGPAFSAILQAGGSSIISGHFNGFTPLAEIPVTGGFEVMFQSGTSFVGLDFNVAGAFTSAATSVLAGSSFALQSLEPVFNTDLNGDGYPGPIFVSRVAQFGVMAIEQENSAYVLSSGAVSAFLTVGGSPIFSGQFNGYTPEAVIPVTGGFEVMFKNATSFVGLDFNSAGAFTSAATSVLSSGTFALQELETAFSFDLDGDGYIGPMLTTIPSVAPDNFYTADNEFVFSSGAGPFEVLQVSGNPIISGQFNGFTPIDMISAGTGVEVLFKSGTGFVGLDFDSNGNYTSAATPVLAGSSFALESLEHTFFGDLNADGTYGPVYTTLEGSGNLALTQAADVFEIWSGTSKPVLTVAGSAITSGQFNGYTPIAVMGLTGGYEVMFRNGTNFVGLDFDRSGNYLSAATSVLTSGSLALEMLEGSFSNDLNGDGTEGPVFTTIQTHEPAFTLYQEANEYTIWNNAGLAAVLQVNGSPIISGNFNGYSAVGIISNTGGYEVMFGNGSQYIGLEFNGTGNYTGPVTAQLAGSSFALQSLENTFGIDLNGDGVVGLYYNYVDNGGSLYLYQAADEYEIYDGTRYTVLTVGGTPISSGHFNGYTPVAVTGVTGGYAVMFENGANFIRLDFNIVGSYTSATGVMTGETPALWAQETVFDKDFNADGFVGQPQTKTLSIVGGTTFEYAALSNAYYLLNNLGSGPAVSLNGAPISPGEFGAYDPYAAVAVPGGYEVVFEEGGSVYQLADSAIVWELNSAGNYVSTVTGPLPEEDFAIQKLVPLFGEALDYYGFVTPTQTALGVSTLTLTHTSPATLVQLTSNVAYDASGLANGTITLNGVPGTLFLTSATAEIEITLQPSNGIEVISGYQYGLDELNIDLKGAASSVLTVGSGTYNGHAAITLYSSADPTHGVILVGYGTTVTSASVLANDTNFIGGHALIN